MAESRPDRRARVYRTARTAHLERQSEFVPAVLLYATRRYDFDPALAQDVGAVQARGVALIRRLARARYDVVEVNEPLDHSSVGRAAVTVAAVRALDLLRRHRTRVVTYAIDNAGPTRRPTTRRPRELVRRRAAKPLSRLVWGQLDAIAFGTPAAAETYRGVFGAFPLDLATTVLPALPAPCPCVEAFAKEPLSVVFLGQFSQRKGLPLVLDAWPQVAERVAGARLRILGKGPLEELARKVAEARLDADLEVDPPRAHIHDMLARASVLVLVSQPVPGWREQVGLPIVEGLAHGCHIVTTDETGLATWLAEHGHGVIPASSGAAAVAEEVIQALQAVAAGRRKAEQVLAALPQVDGRLAADRWLLAAG